MTNALRLFLPLTILPLCIQLLDAQAPARPPVRVAPVVRSTAAIPVEAVGRLSRCVETTLAFMTGGLVETVAVRAGDTVKRGQVLARLRLAEADALLVQARSQAEKSRRDLARLDRLKPGAAITVEEFENARTALELAEAQLRIAEFNRRHAEIIAPDDGAILDRQAEPDQWVSAGQAILRFGSERAGWRVTARLAETEARRLQIGDEARVEGAEGIVTSIAGAVDPLTGTVAVEVDCREGPVGARSNGVVSLTLFPRPGPERAAVPVSSLIAGVHGSQRAFLIAAGSDVARSFPVEVEALHDGMAYLNTALPDGLYHVVTQGGEYLRDGVRVFAVDAP